MVLVISSKRRISASISNIFHYLSILSFHTIPMEALNEITPLYRAVLITNPSELADKCEYLERLRSYTPAIPVFAVTDTHDALDLKIFDGIFKFSELNALLPDKINEYARSHGLSQIGQYRYGGINADFDQRFVTYFGNALTFTKTESMIIRLLIKSYPYPVPVKLILRYSFKSGRTPEPSSVRTHVSIINKKLRLAGEELAIRMIDGEGYKFDFPHTKLEEISEENTARYKLR